MKDFDALKELWHSQAAVSDISYEEIFSNIKNSKNSFSKKLLKETAAILAVLILFVSIWLKNEYMMWSTHLALCVFIICCLYYLFVQLNDYKSISNSEPLLKQPEEYINYLKSYRSKRYRFNTNNYKIYSAFIGLAFSLYFIEVYFVSPLWQTLAGVTGIIIWFIICWYLMKVYTRKEQEKLTEMINALERLERQFSADH